MVFILNMYTGGVFNIYFKIGIEDKIISTRGYCCVTTDEGTGSFDDLKKKESKHESDLSLLNQLCDGKGDKTTLAQNRERIVSQNSTLIIYCYSRMPLLWA